jgi:hypothetical protein
LQPDPRWHSAGAAESTLCFREACANAGVDVVSVSHPLTDPDGRPLSTDTAWFGPADASRLLVVVSGIHGLEALPGSALQVGWIAALGTKSLPTDTALLLVHQINPWGCAFRRRCNEDNIDLNRNFLSFDQPLPVNTMYPGIHDSLQPGPELGEAGEYSGRFLGQLVSQHGIEYVIDLLMAGQHQFADGFGFGGQEASWSHRTLEALMTPFSAGRERVCYLELHSGLGPYGYGQVISLQPEPVLARTRRWFGQWVFNPMADRQPGEPGYREVTGHSTDAFFRYFPDAEVTPVTLEMGTYPPQQSLAALLQEHVLYRAGDAAPAGALAAVRETLQEYHFPADPHWRSANWTRGIQVIQQALEGLNDDRSD